MSDVLTPEADQELRRPDMPALARRPMTVDDFLHRYSGIEGRWELVRGVPVMMAGGTIRHGDVAANVLTALRNKLRGRRCKAFGSDVGIQVDIEQYRLPDVSVLCDPRDIEVDELQRAHFPKVLVEVFSPSTAEADRGAKLLEYRRIPSVEAIVHVDPVLETVELYERTGPREWRETPLPRSSAIPLEAIGVTLTAEDVFRRD